jgi:hypothetical protein
MFRFPNGPKTIEDMWLFLQEHKRRMDGDMLFQDYYTFIKTKFKALEYSRKNWTSTNNVIRLNSLSGLPGQHEVLATIFRKKMGSTPGISYGGREVLEQEVDVSRTTGKQAIGKNPLRYIVTFKFRKYGDGEYPVLTFQQHRDEGKDKMPSASRQDDYSRIYKKSKRIAENLLRERKYKDLRPIEEVLNTQESAWHKGQDTKEILGIWFYDGIASETVCNFMSDFVERISR